MFKSFDLAPLRASLADNGWKEPRVLVRGLLVVLVAANLAAASFAFHLFGRSPEQLEQDLAQTQRTLGLQRQKLQQTKQIAGKVERARHEGDLFLASYMTPRRSTYSVIVSELQQAAETSGMTWKEAAIAPLDPVKGSNDISMMTITASFESPYSNLVKFIHLLDRSPRFLIIETLQAAPQPGGKALNITVKVNTFVRDDVGDAI